MSHTEEPWSIDEYGRVKADGCNEFLGVQVDGFSLNGEEESKANSRRIVACINACAGISTEFLENVTPHQVKTLVGFAGDLDRATASIDQLRELCASIYQFAGAMDAPVDVLDALSNAANGDGFTMPKMPYDVHPCEKERDTYRDLCAELLKRLQDSKPYVEDCLEQNKFSAKFIGIKIGNINSSITKAETILGEKNVTASKKQWKKLKPELSNWVIYLKAPLR